MDFSVVLQPVFNAFWYLIPLVILAAVIKTPWFKGWIGESIVNLSAWLFLDKKTYHLIRNVTLPTEDGTTQIDHIIVAPFGVFVVETKNMKGWIFGSDKQRQWTQKIYRYSQKFQNPLHQNYKHVKTLQALLGLSDKQIHSVVVFVGNSTFKTPMPENVTKGLGYVRYIRSKNERVLSLEQVTAAKEKVASGRLKPSFSTDQAHARHVRGLVAERYGTSSPRRSRGGLLKILFLPAMILGIGVIAVNAFSNVTTGAAAIVMRHAPDQQTETSRQPSPQQPEAQPKKAESRTAGTKTDSGIGIKRVDQPPSGLFLAKQECNSLISAAMGNRDPRLLRDRDKACARYKVS